MEERKVLREDVEIHLNKEKKVTSPYELIENLTSWAPGKTRRWGGIRAKGRVSVE